MLLVTGLLPEAYNLQAKNKYVDLEKGLPYLSVSAGTGIWYKSFQPGTVAKNMPYSVFAEYGRTNIPLSIVGGACFRSVFSIGRFMLNPNYLLAGLQYAPFKGTGVSENFNLYGIAGLNISYSEFTEDFYPGIINYEYKKERHLGAGICAGIAAGYRIKTWEIKPALLLFTGQSEFYAGYFTRQKFNTGTLQFHLTLSRKIIFNSNSIKCPVYNRYYRP